MIKKLLFSICHALFLVVVTICLQYSYFSRTEESFLIKWVSLVKYKIFTNDKKPDLNNAIFLDVSRDIDFIDRSDTYYQGAREIITDRKKITDLFKLIQKLQGRYKYVMCDIILDDETRYDSVLASILKGMPNVIFPSYFDDGALIQPVLPVHNGVIQYKFVEGGFSKFQICFGDSAKSLPVEMYEDISGTRFYKKCGLIYADGRFTFNTIIPELYIRNADLKREGNLTDEANLFYLGALLIDSANYINYLRDKYIIIGNFEQDIHKTYLGDIPGPLILFNSFITLQEKKYDIQWSWLFMVFSFYVLITIHIMYSSPYSFQNLQQKINTIYFKAVFAKYISYLGFLTIILLLSYFIYNLWIHVLYLAAYLTVSKSLLELYRKNKKDKKDIGVKDVLKSLKNG